MPQLMIQEPTQQITPQAPGHAAAPHVVKLYGAEPKPSKPLNLMLGLLGEVALVAVMFALNSELAKYGSPMQAS
ncbi:hypothetical protein [Shewanella marisflavi]|uniref:hypothetical protein n=1 Tax=Shewanella marisflavi TaxID=260364 RepID=UPI003AAA592E